MGRIVKSFTARTASGKVTGEAKIDTGADRTIIAYPLACRLGLDIDTAPRAAMSTAGGHRLVGFSLKADIQIDSRRARVDAFVPLGTLGSDNNFRKVPARSLIGHDFLRRSGTQLDYSKPHANVMRGTAGWPFEWKIGRVTAQEERLLRTATCPRRRP